MEASEQSNYDGAVTAFPGADAVRSQLDRIAGSMDFIVPERIRAFLQFIVDETLCGRQRQLKAYTIAIAVFGRCEDFDAMNDPVVRIEAARLRRALERYYLLDGKRDPVVIEVAKGSYVPTFRWQDATPPQQFQTEPLKVTMQSRGIGLAALANHPWSLACALFLAMALSLTVVMQAMRVRSAAQPTTSEDMVDPEVIVRPFVSLSASSECVTFAAALSEEVLNRLSQLKRLRVFGKDSSTGVSTASLGDPLVPRYILEGSVRQSGDSLRIIARLVDSRTAAIKWAYSMNRDPRTASNLEAVSAAELADLVALQTTKPSSAADAPARGAQVLLLSKTVGPDAQALR